MATPNVADNSGERLQPPTPRTIDPAVTVAESLMEALALVRYDRALLADVMRTTRDLHNRCAERDVQLRAAQYEIERGAIAIEKVVELRGRGTAGVGRRRLRADRIAA
jgi:hypothetical protein